MIEKTLDGKIRAFIFSTRTFVFIRELTGVDDIDEVFQRLVNRKKKVDGEDVSFTEVPIVSHIAHVDFLVKVLLSCAKTASERQKEPIDFDESDIYAWYDEMGVEESFNLINNLTLSYVSKNLKGLTVNPKQEAA